MPNLAVNRFTYLFTILVASGIAVLTVAGHVKSDAVLGAAILVAIATTAFQLGVQYQDLERT